MSLMRTLARVALGVAAAKAGHAIANRNRDTGRVDAGTRTGGGGLLDSVREAARGGTVGGSAGGGLGSILGGRGSNGGLGGLLEEFGGTGGLGGLLSGTSRSGSGGGLGALLGSGAAGGALGGLLSSLTSGGNTEGTREPAMGRRLNEALASGGEPDDPPTPEEEMLAALMIRAMIMAAKSDGQIDQTERDAILGYLDDLDPAERQFVQDELTARISPDEFARDVPDHPGVKAQIFVAALSAIDVDNPAERRFVEDLADALDVDRDARGRIERRMSDRFHA